MDLMSKRKKEFLKTSDDAISERFEPFNKITPHLKDNHGVPNLSKGSERTCEFDKIAKPKYNCHHYLHDPNYEFCKVNRQKLVAFSQ